MRRKTIEACERDLCSHSSISLSTLFQVGSSCGALTYAHARCLSLTARLDRHCTVLHIPIKNHCTKRSWRNARDTHSTLFSIAVTHNKNKIFSKFPAENGTAMQNKLFLREPIYLLKWNNIYVYFHSYGKIQFFCLRYCFVVRRLAKGRHARKKSM